MKKILVPVDGTMRSLTVFKQIKKSFSPKVFEVFLIMVHDSFEYTLTRIGSEEKLREMEEKLNSIASCMPEYEVHKVAKSGKPGPKIIEYADEINADMIIMTRSTSAGMANAIGSTSKYVLSHAHCGVLFVNDSSLLSESQYRGLVYKKESSIVNLRGQLSLKHSECLLPIAYGKLLYHIDVRRGRVRFVHRSFNEETQDWDICPDGESNESIEISEGETKDIVIEVKHGVKPDRVRVINRGMKTEAVFSYDVKILERYNRKKQDND